MKIIALADIHGYVEHLKPDSALCRAIGSADVVLIAGDITHFGGAKEAAWVLSSLKQYNENVFAVTGNCDQDTVGEYLRAESMNLSCDGTIAGDVVLVGINWSQACEEHTTTQTCEEHIATYLSNMDTKWPTGKDMIFVSHRPAGGTVVDEVSIDRHVGSMAIRDFIEKHQPVLAISGHIHEAICVGKLGRTTLVNPGPFGNGRYARIELGQGGVVTAELQLAGEEKTGGW